MSFRDFTYFIFFSFSSFFFSLSLLFLHFFSSFFFFFPFLPNPQAPILKLTKLTTGLVNNYNFFLPQFNLVIRRDLLEDLTLPIKHNPFAFYCYIWPVFMLHILHLITFDIPRTLIFASQKKLTTVSFRARTTKQERCSN